MATSRSLLPALLLLALLPAHARGQAQRPLTLDDYGAWSRITGVELSPHGRWPILQWSQGRMGDQPWDDFERWVSQSPVHHAPGISTPFLILHGTEDGAVDWNQGLELYAAARRLGKEVILLSYPGEPHHLGKEANQKDFQQRMMEFFDHHLKGADAPAWMTDGVPFLEKGKEKDRKAVS